jgi:hypothetical protein
MASEEAAMLQHMISPQQRLLQHMISPVVNHLISPV